MARYLVTWHKGGCKAHFEEVEAAVLTLLKLPEVLQLSTKRRPVRQL